jgi:uncharacterized repeat protein (TIGR03943 family)
MQAKVSNIINAVTLIALGTVFLSFCWSGRIDPYLNPLFRPLVLVGGLLTVLVGVTRLLTLPSAHCRSEGGCDHHHVPSEHCRSEGGCDHHHVPSEHRCSEGGCDHHHVPSEHRCSEGDCDHHHVSSLSRTLASFGVICVSVLAGSTFSKDAFDQQIFVNRGSTEDDSSLSGPYASNAGIPTSAFDRVPSKNGVVRDQLEQLRTKPGASEAGSSASSAGDCIAVEVTDLLRARTAEPLRNAIAGKNVAVVGQFVPGSTEKNFKLTRMFIWCCAADARPIHVTVEVSAPVHVPELQWVKVVGKPEYSIAEGHAHLFFKADSVVPIQTPKDAMLY